MKAIVIGGSGLIGKVVIQVLNKVDIETINFDMFKPDEYFDCTSPFSRYFLAHYIQKYKIDIVINCSYPRTTGYGKDDTVTDFEDNVKMHMDSVCWLSKVACETMAKNKIEGTVINFGSIYGIVGPDMSIYKGTYKTMPGVYAAIKGGIISYSRFLATVFGKHNIRVNCISPGGVYDKSMSKRFVKNYCKNVPLGRMAKPEEVAQSVLYLISATYTTGQNLIVDGGWTAK